jgi:hypothetical protein
MRQCVQPRKSRDDRDSGQGVASKSEGVKATNLHLKNTNGNNFDYFNIYCTQILASLSVFTNITFLGVPSQPALRKVAQECTP